MVAHNEMKSINDDQKLDNLESSLWLKHDGDLYEMTFVKQTNYSKSPSEPQCCTSIGQIQEPNV